MKQEPAQLKNLMYVLTCYLLWGVLVIFWKQLAALPPFYVLGARILWSVPLLAAALTLRRDWGGVAAAWRDKRELGRLTAAGFLICINWGVYIWAVNANRVLDASLAYYMSPILSILLGTLFFRERLTALQWLSVALTAAGLAIAMVRYGRFPWVSLAIGGSFALYSAVKKGVKADAGTSLFYETLSTAPLMLAFVVWSELRHAGAVGVLHGWQWLLLPLAGIVTAIPLLFFAMGIRYVSLTAAGLLMYINPTLQLLLGVLLYHEKFTTTHAILFGFVWSGVALYLCSGLCAAQKEKIR